MRKLVIVMLLVAFGACAKEATETKNESAGGSKLESYWRTSIADASKEVKVVKDEAKNGDKVVVRGRIKDVRDVAQITLMDRAIRPCNGPGDPMGENCPTPWDYCCIDVDTQTANTITVEFREGEDLVATSVKSFHGLDHLSDVVVSGKVERDEHGNVVLVADGITLAVE